MSGHIRDYLSFTRSEKRGILILLSVIMILVSLPHIFQKDAIIPDPEADALYKVEAEEFLKGIQQEGNSYGDGSGGSGYGDGRNYDSDRNYNGNRNYSNDRNYNNGRSSFNDGSTNNNVRNSRPYHTRFKPRPFDPNTSTAGDYISMGFSEKQAAVIIRYRNKGGSFRIKEDFSKLYIVDSSTYEIFEPYINIENQVTDGAYQAKANNAGELPGSERQGNERNTERSVVNVHGAAGSVANSGAEGSIVNSGVGFKKNKTLIELNSADSLELIKIYGVGPVFASRILKYRNKTGGFYRIEQLAEVYGIDSTRYASIAPQVRVDTTLLIKININTITLEALRGHPYIDYYTAKALIDKRVKLGSYKTMDEIRQVLKGKEGLFERVKGYVEITSPRPSPQGEGAPR